MERIEEKVEAVVVVECGERRRLPLALLVGRCCCCCFCCRGIGGGTVAIAAADAAACHGRGAGGGVPAPTLLGWSKGRSGSPSSSWSLSREPLRAASSPKEPPPAASRCSLLETAGEEREWEWRRRLAFGR